MCKLLRGQFQTYWIIGDIYVCINVLVYYMYRIYVHIMFHSPSKPFYLNWRGQYDLVTAGSWYVVFRSTLKSYFTPNVCYRAIDLHPKLYICQCTLYIVNVHKQKAPLQNDTFGLANYLIKEPLHFIQRSYTIISFLHTSFCTEFHTERGVQICFFLMKIKM